MIPDRSLQAGFLRSAETFPDRTALEVAGEVVSYKQLRDRAFAIAGTLAALPVDNEVPLTAVFAYRSVTAFAGVLAALIRGHGYVPLNRTFPPERTRLMLDRSGCKAVIVDQASAAQLPQVLRGIERQLTLILPDVDDTAALAAELQQHRVLGRRDLTDASADSFPAQDDPDSLAYLLFTSGSTGQPKGVMVSQQNVRHYVDYVSRRYRFTCEDRLSQTFDMTFDLSAHDMFVAWENGACVCCPTQKQLIKPGAFINDSRLTAWFSVPSTAVFMRRFNVLKPGAYPGLRLTLFCGEALPVDVAREWAEAAPNSIIENIYGPTELTIACTAYRWDGATSPFETEQGVVPIGEPFEDMRAVIVDENLQPLIDGIDGELVMTGPQLSRGYWQDEEKTRRAFVKIPGHEGTFYRTGDRVRRAEPGKPLLYLGRLDSQIKVLGHRVELGEVEAAVREVSGIDGVVAFGWPMSASGADGIEVFLQAQDCDTCALVDRLKARLPGYMVPRNIHLLNQFPLNGSGKFDRPALRDKLAAANP